MPKRPSLTRNIFSNWTGFAVTVVIGFVLSPFVVHTLGDTRYGVWSIVGSLTGYLGLFDFGVRVSLIKFVSEFRARRDWRSLNELVNTALLIYLTIFALILAAALALFYLAPHWFKVPATHHDELRWAVLLMGINVGLSLFTGVFGGVLGGSQRYDILSIMAIVLNLAKAAAVFTTLSMGGRLLSLCGIELGYTLAGLMLKVLWSKREIPDLVLSPIYRSRAIVKRIVNYSGYMFLMVLAVRLIFYTDILVIGTFLSAAHVTYFAIGTRLVEYLRRFMLNMSNVFNPRASELDAVGNHEGLRQLMIGGSKSSLFMTLPIGIGFLVFAEPFIVLWMGPEYRVSALIMTILTIPQLVALPQLTSGAILNGIGRHKFNALMALGEAFANLGLSIALVQTFGIAGVAAGTCIPLLLTQTFFLPVYTCRVLGLPLGRYLREAWVRPLMVALPFALLAVAARTLFYPDTWLVFFIETASLSGIYAFLALFYGINERELDTLPILRRLPLLVKLRQAIHRTVACSRG